MKLYIQKSRMGEYLQEHKLKKLWWKITLFLAALVAIVVSLAMVLPALTMENGQESFNCLLNLHTHVDSCYDEDGNLVCGYADFVVHTHNEFCYNDSGELICPLEEIHTHTHNASCYQTNLIPVCDLKETDGHIHTEECYSSEHELICGHEETAPHTHTSDCFETQEILVCAKEEIIIHTHTSDCFDEEGRLICGQREVREHIHAETCVSLQNNEEVSFQNETSWATVCKSGFLSAKSRLAAANNSRAASIDFTQYITGISLSREIDGQWVPVTTEVISGDSIRVHITYSIPENIVWPDSNVIHYQFPTGIGLREPASGPVTIGSEAAGTYLISTSGLIQITFTNEFADGSAFIGELEFLGMVTATGESGQNQIELGFDGGTIIVKPSQEPGDLTITKTGVYDNLQNLITYTITVFTETGTDGNVNIEDTFIHAPQYGVVNYGTILSFRKKDAQGNYSDIQNVQSYLTVIPQTAERAASFALKNLPALQAGEAYILIYTAIPDLNSLGNGNGYLLFTNRATAKDQTQTAEASANIQVSKAMISKEYTYDVLTRKIQWKILINEDHKDISGWTFNDVLTYTADGREYTMDLPDRVTITAFWNYAPTGISYEIPLPFTFPENSNAQYMITYETEIPTNVSSENGIVFHNTAAIEDYWVKVDVESPAIGEYGVIKGCIGNDKETGTIQWAASIAHPNPPVLDQMHYVDLLSGAVTEDGIQLLESHYTTRSLLENSLNVWTVDGVTKLIYGTDYTVTAVSKADVESFMKQNGVSIENLSWLVAEYQFSDMVGVFPWKDVYAFSADEPLGMFAVLFTDSALVKISNANLLVTYNTQIEKSYLPENTKKVTVYNLGRIPDDYSLAQVEMSIYEKIDKQVSPMGVHEASQDTSSFTDNPLIVSSGDAGELLHYRIMISDYGENTELTVTDILPAGTELIKESVVMRRHSNNWDTFTDETKDAYYIQEVNVTNNADGTTTVTFLIGHLEDLQNDSFGIYYDVSIANDTQLKEEGEKIYINTASWNGNTDSTSTTVEYRLPHLEKTGEVFIDEEILRYYIVINPEGERLNPYDDKLTLEDKLTIPTGSEAFFEPNTVKLFRYDETAENNHFCGTLIDASKYAAQYDSQTRTITFTLPDSTACVLVYDYSIDRGTAAGELVIFNVAKLSGRDGYSSESDLVIEEQQSSATVNKATLTIFKYESGNMLKLLPGARFKLERYERDSTGYTWKQTSLTAAGEAGEFVVGDDGMLIMSFVPEEQGGGSLYNTLYRLQETAPPQGYLKKDDFYYFVWMEKDATEESTIAQMSASGMLGDIPLALVQFIPYSTSQSLYVPNEADKLTVIKKWRSDTGEVLTNPPVNSVFVTLYQWTQDGQKRPYETEVELSEANNWSYTWESLPKNDGNGDPYLYTVEETPIANFEITYSQNNEQGIQIGNIEITNKRKGYILPETGGFGAILFTIAGLILIGAFGIGYIVLRRRGTKIE